MYLKKILIDATGIVTTPTGVGKYSYYLLAAMLRNKKFRFHFSILHQSNLPRFHPLFLLNTENVKFLPARIPVVGPLRDIHLLKLRQEINRHDLLHCLHTYLPAFGVKIPSIVTIHDLKYLMFPEFFDSRLKPLYYNWIIRRGVRKATRVIAISATTKKDLVNLVDISVEKITVIHEAATISSIAANVDSKLPAAIGGKPFLFFVGKNKPHKNIGRIIEAHRRLKNTLGDDCPYFVFAGPGFNDLRKKYVDIEKSTKIIFLGLVDDETLVNLYKHAIALVYPSLYEGFGLPVLEAMTMGVPVITSNCSSLPEVAGRAAIFVDPYNVKQLVDAVLILVQDKSERERLSNLGQRRAREFSWEHAANMTLKLYIDILSNIHS